MGSSPSHCHCRESGCYGRISAANFTSRFFAVYSATILWNLRSLDAHPIGPSHQFLVLGVCSLMVAILSCVLAVNALIRHMRWGPVPRTITVSHGSLKLSWLGFRTMREQCWPSANVRLIQLQKVKDVFSRKPIFRVRIRLKNRLDPRLLITTKDHQLATQIHEALTRVLGVPCSPG
jgi:hypothetical protein